MRAVKIITIEGVGEVTVKEISPYALYTALAADSRLAELTALAEECFVLPEGKNLQKLYGSEIEQLVDAFMAVNTPFFSIAEKLGLKTTLASVLSEIVTILPPLFAGALRAAIPAAGTTAGLSS